MPLTPEDVSNKRFTTVRLREGYDMTEVDQFLDEVESALATMTRENDELRSKLQVAQGGEPVAETAPPEPAAEAPEEAPAEAPEEAAEEAAADEAPAEAVSEPEAPAEEPVSLSALAAEGAPTPVVEPVAEPDAVAPVAEPAAHLEHLRVSTTAEASVAATRLLELAGRNADELVLEARQQAEEIVVEARTTAETVETEARQRAESLDIEIEERRRSVFGDIERQKTELDQEINDLRTFEREYRTQLKSYFEQQLEALDGHGEGGSLAEPMGLRDTAPAASGEDTGQDPSYGDEPDGEAHEPNDVSRLQALLSEDEEHRHQE